MGCARQQRLHGHVVAGVEPCGAVGTRSAAGSRGIEAGGSPREGAEAICGGSETLPQNQQQAQGQHHMCAPLAQHPSRSLQQDVTGTSGSGITGPLPTHPPCPASWNTLWLLTNPPGT